MSLALLPGLMCFVWSRVAIPPSPSKISFKIRVKDIFEGESEGDAFK